MSMRKSLAVVAFAAPLALVACGGGEKQEAPAAAPATTQAAAPAAGAGGAAKGSASISGKISFAGTAPASEKIKVSADPYCQKEHKDGLERKTVDVKESVDFAEALKKTGTRHELVIVEGAPHTFHLQPKEQDLRPKALAFFDKHLKGK